MSFCPSCGKPLSEGAAKCGYCGVAVRASAVAATVAPQSAGMSVNAAGALAYLAGFITGIIFLVVDPYKRDPFVRFHAFQSIFFNIKLVSGPRSGSKDKNLVFARVFLKWSMRNL